MGNSLTSILERGKLDSTVAAMALVWSALAQAPPPSVMKWVVCWQSLLGERQPSSVVRTTVRKLRVTAGETMVVLESVAGGRLAVASMRSAGSFASGSLASCESA